jgi:hypothetical protein
MAPRARRAGEFHRSAAEALSLVRLDDATWAAVTAHADIQHIRHRHEREIFEECSAEAQAAWELAHPKE